MDMKCWDSVGFRVPNSNSFKKVACTVLKEKKKIKKTAISIKVHSRTLHPGMPDQNEVQQNQVIVLHGQNRNKGSRFQWHKKALSSDEVFLVGWLWCFLFLIFVCLFLNETEKIQSKIA